MNINLEYEIGKGLVADYIETMERECQATKNMITEFDNNMLDYDKFEYFDRDKAFRFVKTWDIIQSDSISIVQRNLICAFAACNNKLDECLAFFNGKGKNIKNKRTLAVIISNARKAVIKEYEKKYG